MSVRLHQIRNVTGRLQVDPTHSLNRPTFHTYLPTERKNSPSEQENFASDTDVQMTSYSSVAEDSFPGSSSPSFDSMAKTPLTSKRECYPSSSDSDGDQLYATARGKWSSFRTEISNSYDGGYSDIPGTAINSQSRPEMFFASPAVPISQLAQHYSLPFDSAVKKIGFNTGDATSSDYVIRDAFEDFSPVGHTAGSGFLPTRRKVRFSEG